MHATPLALAASSESATIPWLQEDHLLVLDRTPFLSACRDGTATRPALERFLLQQYFYSRQFTRYLCALLANIESDEHRRELSENLVDEIGLGKSEGVPHSVIYRSMLTRLGLDPMKTEILPETQKLIDVMWQSCRNPNPAVGLGALCLGAEAIVPHVYSQIVTGFLAAGESRDNLEFFTIHIACDDDHALTMKKIIEQEITSPSQQRALAWSAEQAIMARVRFFEALGV